MLPARSSYCCLLSWITGTSYSCYGPLLSGARFVIFEGIPTYPTPSRWWDIVEKYHVRVMFTAATALRTLSLAPGADRLRERRLPLRVLGAVGEHLK